MKICFIDSGIGGLSVYSAFVEELANNKKLAEKVEHIYYFADFAHSPYGEKTKDDIVEILCDNIVMLYKKYQCQMFILACNTATACAISSLRKKFSNFVLVGIEPAIKMALQNQGNVLVMCTSATYFYSDLLYRYRNTKGVYFLPLSTLASKIDKNYKDDGFINKELQKCLLYFKDKQIQNVVLGCTHYAFLKGAISRQLGNVKFYDSTKGVIKRILDLLTKL